MSKEAIKTKKDHITLHDTSEEENLVSNDTDDVPKSELKVKERVQDLHLQTEERDASQQVNLPSEMISLNVELKSVISTPCAKFTSSNASFPSPSPISLDSKKKQFQPLKFLPVAASSSRDGAVPEA